MLKSIEDINTTKKRLKIEIPSDVLENEITSSIEKIRNRARIPGFRQGKAPVSLIEKRYGKEVEAEVLEKVIPEYFRIAMMEAEIKPVTMPELDEEVDFKRNNPLNLSITVEVLPKIGEIDYENIKVKDIPVSVEDSDVETTLKSLQDKKAVFEVADKVVEMDNLVSFDIVDTEAVSGEIVPSAKEAISKMGNELFPPDIMQIVLGKKKDDVVEFTKEFDDKFENKEIAGKTFNIKVQVKEIKKKSLPEIDDEFAKDIGFDSLSVLNEKIKENILKAKQEQVKKIQQAEILNRLIESHSFEVPESMLQREMKHLMTQGKTPGAGSSAEDTEAVADSELSDVIAESVGQEQGENKPEDFQNKFRHKAEKNVQASIIVDMIGQKEGITVTEEEMNQRISLIARRLSATPEAVKTFFTYQDGSLEGLKHSIFEEKVMDMLLSRAAIEKEENK